MLGKCLEYVRKIVGKCLEKTLRTCLENGGKMPGKCLENVRRMLGKYLENDWKMLGRCFGKALKVGWGSIRAWEAETLIFFTSSKKPLREELWPAVASPNMEAQGGVGKGSPPLGIRGFWIGIGGVSLTVDASTRLEAQGLGGF